MRGFHLLKKQKKANMKGHKSTISLLSILRVPPPALLSLCARLFVSLSCIHVSFRSLMAACYVISVCFSRRWQLLQWSKMDCAGKWRQLSVAVLRDVFALLQRWRTTNPWHPPFRYPPPPLPPPLLPSHLDTATVCSDLAFVFFLFHSEWQLMAEIFYTCLNCLFLPLLPFFILKYIIQFSLIT